MTTPVTPLPPTNFDEWTLETAKQAVKGKVHTWFAEVRDYMEGRHWRGSKGWVGPHVNPNLDEGDTVMAEVERGFVSANKVDEITTTHRDAVVGTPVMWHAAPRDFQAPGAEMDEAQKGRRAQLEAMMTKWWDRVNAPDALAQIVLNLLCYARADARHIVPPNLVVTGEDGTTGVPVSTVEQALDSIFLEVLDPESATVYRHPKTLQEVTIVLVREDNLEWAELTFLDPSGATIFKKVGMPNTPAQRVVTNLGRRLNVVESTRRRFVTQQILENQKALNLALSMIPRNVVTGGFIERTMLNAQMPGTYEYNDDGSVKNFVPASYRLGPGSTAWLVGVKTTDALGNEQIAQPTIERGEPVDPKASITAVSAHERLILSEAKQEHVLTNSDNLMSGKSREQARHRFVGSCRPTKNAAEYLTVFILEGALALAEWFAGDPGVFSNEWRFVALATIDTGPVGADEREQDLAMVNAGTMSPELQMERAGVLDVDAERARIRSDELYTLRLWKERFTVLGLAEVAGVPVEVAAEFIGVPDTEVAKMKKGIEEKRQQAVQDQLTTKPPVAQGGGDTRPKPANAA